MRFEQLVGEYAQWEPGFQPPPIIAYSLSDADARRALLSDTDRRDQSRKNMTIYSKYLPGPDFNIVAVVDVGGDDPIQSVLLLYAEGLIQGGPTRTHPVWYQIGVPNIFNGLLIRDDGSMILSRFVPFEPVVEKGKGSQIKYGLKELLDITPQQFASGDIREYSRRAREWAQFGLLTTPEHRKRFYELATLMRQGEPAEEAVRDAFEMSLEDLAKEYEEGKWRKELTLKLPAPQRPIEIPAPSKIESQEVQRLLAVLSSRATAERH